MVIRRRSTALLDALFQGHMLSSRRNGCLDEINAFVAETTILSKGVAMNKYSDFFKTLHDEVAPTGYLGRGSHYSVLRSIVWHSNLRHTLPKAAYLDLAVIWDEDHDIRVIEAIELLHLSGLLSPAIFVGERKGCFSLIVSEKTFEEMGKERLYAYQEAVEDITQSLSDPWAANVLPINVNTQRHFIINDDSGKVSQYLHTINMLWQLGIKPAQYMPSSTSEQRIDEDEIRW